MKPHPTRRKMILAAGAGMALPAAAWSQQANTRLGITGQLAPELEIDQWIDGKGQATSFNLAEQRGKFVVMKFWQAWCPGCMKSGFPTMQKLHAAFKDNPRVMLLAVQTVFEGYLFNTSGKMRAMQERFELPIVMGHDAGNWKTDERPGTMHNYRSGGTPWIVLVSPEGRVLFNDFHINTDGAIDYLERELTKLG